MAGRSAAPVALKAAPDPHVVTLRLTGPDDGQEVVVRTDRLRRKHLRAAQEAPDQNAAYLVLFDLIEMVAVRWTVRDAATGAPLPQPSEGGVDDLTTRQLMAIYDALNAHNQAASELPKA